MKMFSPDLLLTRWLCGGGRLARVIASLLAGTRPYGWRTTRLWRSTALYWRRALSRKRLDREGDHGPRLRDGSLHQHYLSRYQHVYISGNATASTPVMVGGRDMTLPRLQRAVVTLSPMPPMSAARSPIGVSGPLTIRHYSSHQTLHRVRQSAFTSLAALTSLAGPGGASSWQGQERLTDRLRRVTEIVCGLRDSVPSFGRLRRRRPFAGSPVPARPLGERAPIKASLGAPSETVSQTTFSRSDAQPAQRAFSRAPGSESPRQRDSVPQSIERVQGERAPLVWREPPPERPATTSVSSSGGPIEPTRIPAVGQPGSSQDRAAQPVSAAPVRASERQAAPTGTDPVAQLGRAGIDRIAQEVIRRIERKVRIERERRGL
jgi:hypothetical protein